MEGTGKIYNPYLIASEQDLRDIALDPAAHYRLENDIELTAEWTTLPSFSGVLDGGGHVITGLEVLTSADSFSGFFNRLLPASRVSNLTLVTTANGINGLDTQYTAILAGRADGDQNGLAPTIERVVCVGTVNGGGNRVGGFIGSVFGVAASPSNGALLLNECACFAVVNGGGTLIGTWSGYTQEPDLIKANFCYTSTEYSGVADIIRPYTTYEDITDLAAADISDPTKFLGWDFTDTWEMTTDGYPRIIAKPEGSQPQASKVSGVVQIDGTPAKRTVRAFGYDPTAHTINGTAVSLSKSLGSATSDPDTGEYSIDLLAGYGEQIFVVAFDDYGADFVANEAVAVGARVHPTTPNGHVFECTGAGQLPSEEPTWVVDTETSQLYGTASMIAKPFYRPMVHGPVAPEVTLLAPGDPFYDSVTLLMHMDEDPLVDSSSTPAIITPQDSATYVAGEGKFDGALYMDGSNTGRVETDKIAAIGTEPFTLEAWIRPTEARFARIFSAQSAIEPNAVIAFRINPDRSLLLFMRSDAGGTADLLYSPIDQVDVTGTVYQHVAATRDADGVCRIFWNGQKVAEQIIQTNPDGSRPWWIGALDDTQEVWKGYIDEARITEGICRYAADFTVPLSKFPDTLQAFDPATLFNSGELGAWYDPSDLTLLFQDAAGTVPVQADGDPVALMKDKSGNGYHAYQLDSGKRPIYRTDGSRHWLQGLGVEKLTITNSKTTMRFLHDGTGATIVSAGLFGANANPDETYAVLGSNAGSSNNAGIDLRYDDRAFVPRNNSFAAMIGKAVANNAPFLEAYEDSVTPQTPTVIGLKHSTGATPQVTFDLNAEIFAEQAYSYTPAAVDATYDLEILHNGSPTLSPMIGNFYGAVILDRVVSAEETAKLNQYLADASGATLVPLATTALRWRVYVHSVPDLTYFELAEIELLSEGVDLVAGVSPTTNSTRTGSFGVQNLTDNDAGTRFVSDSETADIWFEWEFGQPTSIDTLSLQVASTLLRMPDDVSIEYSDDGIEWTSAGRWNDFNWSEAGQIETRAATS